MNNNDYSAGRPGYASIYIYRMCMGMHDKKRRSFNKKWNKERPLIRLPELNNSLNPVYVGFTGKRKEVKTVRDRITEHIDCKQGGRKDILIHGSRKYEPWPKGLMIELMDEIPLNTRIPLREALQYEFATAIELANRGYLVFGPSVWELTKKKKPLDFYSSRHQEIWSG